MGSWLYSLIYHLRVNTTFVGEEDCVTSPKRVCVGKNGGGDGGGAYSREGVGLF